MIGLVSFLISVWSAVPPSTGGGGGDATATYSVIFGAITGGGGAIVVTFLWRMSETKRAERAEKQNEALVPMLTQFATTIERMDRALIEHAASARLAADAIKSLPPDELWTRIREHLTRVETLTPQIKDLIEDQRRYLELLEDRRAR